MRYFPLVIFAGITKKTHLASIACRYFPKILSFSRLVRRIHTIPEYIWMTVFTIQKTILAKPEAKLFIIDSLPIQAYENHKSYRAKIFKGKLYHGYIASKNTYFFGIKIHMIIDENGVPIEFCFTPGSMSDMEGIKNLDCEIPSGSILIGDKAYTNYSLEDDLLEMKQIFLMPKRRSNLKRQHSTIQEFVYLRKRNYIESVFSSIVSKMLRYIKVRTEKGFHLKVLLFVLAYIFGLLLTKT